MQLTPYQFAMLKRSQRFHAEGLSAYRLILRHWRYWLVLLVMASTSFLIFLPVDTEVTWSLMGFYLGAFARELGHIRHVIRIWPVSNQITSWERVAELIESHEREQETFNMSAQ